MVLGRQADIETGVRPANPESAGDRDGEISDVRNRQSNGNKML